MDTGTVNAMRHELKSVTGFAVVLIVASIVNPGGQANRAFREDLLAISVVVDVRAPSYTRGNIDEVTVFGSTSLVAVVTLGNHTNETIGLRPDLRDWTEALSVSFEKVGDTPVVTPQNRGAIISQLARGNAATTSIGPHGRLTGRFTIDAPKADADIPGRYRLSVTLDEAKLGPKAKAFRNLLKRELIVNFKQPVTNEELADHYLQLAYQARISGEPTISRQWSQKVLALNPQSIAALNDIGSGLLREGNCVQATPILNEVMRLLSAGEDRGLNITDSGRQELESNIRERLTAQCGL